MSKAPRKRTASSGIKDAMSSGAERLGFFPQIFYNLRPWVAPKESMGIGSRGTKKLTVSGILVVTRGPQH